MLHLKQQQKNLLKPEISPHSLCLTTFASLDAKRSMIQLQFYGTTTNYQ